MGLQTERLVRCADLFRRSFYPVTETYISRLQFNNQILLVGNRLDHPIASSPTCITCANPRGCPADHHVPREGARRTTTCPVRVPGGPPRATRGCPADHHVTRVGVRRTTTCHERVPGGPPRATRGYLADHHVPREGTLRTTRATRPKRVSWRTLETGVTHQPMVYTRTLQ